MDRDTIRRMDPEVFQETLKEAVMDDVACVLNINKGHATSLHAGQSINDMVNRLIKEEKQAVSSFLDTDSLIYDLQDAIYYSANVLLIGFPWIEMNLKIRRTIMKWLSAYIWMKMPLEMVY